MKKFAAGVLAGFLLRAILVPWFAALVMVLLVVVAIVVSMVWWDKRDNAS